MRAIAIPVMGAMLSLFLQEAWGASACPTPSSAPSPSSATAKCVKPATHKVTVAAPPVSAGPAGAPVVTASWKSTLDPLNAGGWAYIFDGPPDNPSAVYASTHNVLHNGNVLTAWMRWEFSRPQADVYPLQYLSAVTREEIDCDARTYRRAGVIYYLRNNLQEKGPSFMALDDDTTWKQAVPGTEADAMLNWGCPSPAAAKAATPAPVASSAPAAPASGATDVHTVR
jgi:hypothetical protein